MQTSTISEQKGPIRWMAKHGVAANLLMATLILGGLIFMKSIGQEVFPEFQLDIVSINVAYPGASPDEVEKGIILAIEDAVSDLDGVDEINSTAKEGVARVLVSAERGADVQLLVQDIQKEVDRITTFPDDAEEPQIKVLNPRRPVMSLVLYGQAKDTVLHELAEQFREQLLQDSNISQVELEGIRPMEISIEVPQENLRRYKLSLSEIATRVQNASVDLPAGSVKTTGGEILIRMKERKDVGQQFANIPIINAANGSMVLLSDIAHIHDGYQDTDYVATFNEQPAVMVQVYNVGDRSPTQVSESVIGILPKVNQQLPDGVKAEIRYDASVDYTDRVNLLLKNSAQGLILVFLSLALFLEMRLAFWVMMGIPTAFLGAFLFLPLFGVTLNMISLFAFIIALGIVVDDAIVIGENVYEYRQTGLTPMQAAIEGAREMAAPVTFSILSNVATFIPLFFIPGEMGKIFFMIPIVIITVFLLSLVEALFVLPNHLGHLAYRKRSAPKGWIHTQQHRFSNHFKHWVQHSYGNFLDHVLRHKYLTIVISFGLLVLTLVFATSGRMGMSAFPKLDSDFAKVTVLMPFGTPLEKSQAVADFITAKARETANSLPNGEQLIRGIFTEIGKTDSNKIELRVYLAPAEIRDKIINTEGYTDKWRNTVGEISGIDSMRFESDAGGPGGGAAITIELNHTDNTILTKAAKELAVALAGYPMAKDIVSGAKPGKQQLDFKVLPEGKSLGLTAQNVARQVRNAFYGAEAIRQQRGRNELKVMVRLPKDERSTATNIDDLLIWTNNGKEIPLREVVEIDRGRAYTEIERHDGHRNIQVTADVTPRPKAGEIVNDLERTELPRLIEKYPGLHYSFQGQQAAMGDSISSLKLSFVFAVLGIYALLAIPFQNYILPLVVLVSIPFGVVGAIWGHLLMGYDLSIISLLGIVALSGVVVNDALVLIDHAAHLRRTSNENATEIIKMAAIQRFRPIILTTLTTFGGLMPMILETSRQAKLLIPMAISLGFGIVFATLITLILIPSLYLVVNDISDTFKTKKHPSSS